jgi:16S rRNA (cytosine967-C5)-methyltransferase
VGVNAPGAAGAPGELARAAAHEALRETLRRKRPLDAVLEDAIAERQLPPRDGGFARAIANETMRRFGQLDDLVRHFVPRTPPSHRAGATLEILLAGTCELLFLATPAHAAVDGANRLAAADSKTVHFKPLINAALRRIAREGAAVANEQDAPRLNTPDWLWTRWCDTYGAETTRAIARVHAMPPPLDLNFSSAHARSKALGGTQMPGHVVRLTLPGSVEEIAGFAEGAFFVQDFAASLPVRLFGDLRGRHVVDLCASPGGKTAQLVGSGADVVAVERDEARLARLAANLDRLKLAARLVLGDARDFEPRELADCVLLDAPCTATGTVRRHPELPWIKSAADVVSCAEGAAELLDAAAAMVKPGGIVVFAVCSLEAEEGSEQIGHFLRRRRDFCRVPIAPSELFGLAQCVDADGDLRTLPCHLAELGGMDGFYAVRLMRASR